MGTILASTIITNARNILGDTGKVRVTDAEFLVWLNSGQREACILKPDIYIVTSSTKMVAGTKQTVPSGFLVDVIRNMGSAGTAAGAAISSITRGMLDNLIPGWHTATANGVAQLAVYDLKNPSVFWLYPPQPATPHYIQLAYSGTPADIASGSAITLADIYETVLQDYLLFRAFSKETEYANAGLANGYYTSFARALGAKVVSERAIKQRDAANAVQG